MSHAVVRIRSSIGANREVVETLDMLGLKRINSLSVVEESDSFRGMLQKVKDYVTWGEIDKELLSELSGRYERLRGVGLHPPRGGFRSVKRPYGNGGDLGYRGEKINELIRRML
jgi:large subunit ribosomal protein L30